MVKYENVNMTEKVFDFLRALAQNNNRDWFAQNKPQYDVIAKENKDFFNQIHLELQKHDSLEAFHVFRIYKDGRSAVLRGYTCHALCCPR